MKLKDIAVGRLRTMLHLQKAVKVLDMGGGHTIEWAPIAVLWSEVIPVSANERYHAMALESNVTHRIITRYRPDISVTPELRIIDNNGTQYNIRGVMDIENRKRFLEILVEEGVVQ